MRPELSERQIALLGKLKDAIGRTGKAPSLRQMAADLGVSHSAVRQLLNALEEKGYVRRDGPYSRNLYLLNPAAEVAGSQRWREIPVVGRIAAGLPLYAQEEWEGGLVVDASLFRTPNLFALKVRGDSMVGAGILSGDLVICEPRQFASNGEIVVALIHQEEATVKRFFRHEAAIELRPENPALSPILYGFDEILIQGKVVGLSRGPETAARM